MKTFAVTIEYTVQETLYVKARRPNGATEKVLTQEGYSEAHMYEEDDHLKLLPKNARVVGVRQV